jgi:hypothetical protein
MVMSTMRLSHIRICTPCFPQLSVLHCCDPLVRARDPRRLVEDEVYLDTAVELG